MLINLRNALMAGGAKIKLLSWIRPSSYTNYIATDFVFQPLKMKVSLEYGLGEAFAGFNYSTIFSESSTNISASQIGSGGKAFGMIARDFDAVLNLTAQASSNAYAQYWTNNNLHKTTDPTNIIVNKIDTTYTSPWNPVMVINGAASSASNVGGRNSVTSSAYSNHGIVFFAHRNGNGAILTMKPGGDWVVPQYFLRSCEFKSIETSETLAHFKAAMNPAGDVGLFDSVSNKFYPSTNGVPLYGI